MSMSAALIIGRPLVPADGSNGVDFTRIRWGNLAAQNVKELPGGATFVGLRVHTVWRSDSAAISAYDIDLSVPENMIDEARLMVDMLPAPMRRHAALLKFGTWLLPETVG